MATGLVDAFAGARARVQNLTAGAGGRAWDVLPSHDAADVPAFLATVLPLLEGAQRQVIALTEAYVARELDRQPLGIRPENVIAGIRGDVTPEEVYRRPFVTLWWGLAQGRRWTEASAAARARLEAALKADVTLAMTHTMAAIVVGDPEVETFRRVTRGTCDLCAEAAGTGAVLMPIHPGCECVAEPSRTRVKTPKAAVARFRPVRGSDQAATAQLVNRRRADFEALSDDAMVEVFHGAAGAGSGATGKTYVTLNYQQAKGFALGGEPKTLRVRKGDLEASPEAKAAGFQSATDSLFGAGEAVVEREKVQGFVEVEEHGELGPILVDGRENFTTAREAARRRND